MKTRLATILLSIPVIFVLLWHLCDRGLPNSDPATYAQVTLQIARAFRQHGLLPGMVALLDIRGWRPIFFPQIAVPFFLLTADVVAGCAATLLMIYVALISYLYRLAYLCTGDRLVAATVSATVLSMPAIVSYSDRKSVV